MKDRWDDFEAAADGTDLGAVAYAGRLLAQEEALTAFEGSGVSLKQSVVNLVGDSEAILFVSPSWHLSPSLQVAELVPLRCEPLARLIGLDNLSPALLANAVACSRTLAASAVPLSDVLLHAALPYVCVLETQPDAVLAIGCTAEGISRLEDLYAGAVLVLPYAASGLEVAQRCATSVEDHADRDLVGIIVLHRGMLTFGESAYQAYSRTIDLVEQAEQYLNKHAAAEEPLTVSSPTCTGSGPEIARLRQAASAAAGRPLVLAAHGDSRCRSLCSPEKVALLSQSGPVVAGQIRLAGRTPVLGQGPDAWGSSVDAPAGEVDGAAVPAWRDGAPRIILSPDLGMCALGGNADESMRAGRQFRHAMRVVGCASALGNYRGMSPNDALAAEPCARSEAGA